MKSGDGHTEIVNYLIKDLQNGKKLYRGLFSRAKYILRNTADTDDVIQTCYLKAVQFGYYYDSKKSAKDTWIYSILNNSIRDILRKKERILKNEPLESVMFLGGYDNIRIPHPEFMNLLCHENCRLDREIPKNPEEHEIKQEQYRELRKAIPKLSKVYRDSILRFYFKGMKYKEIAELRHISIGTVKSRLSTAVKNLSLTDN